MIDLDDTLTRVGRMDPSWTEQRAVAVAEALRDQLGLWIQFEPGDEEWVVLQGDGPYVGMISVRFPLAMVFPSVAVALRRVAPEVVVVPIDDFLAEDMRGSAGLLRSTVLPYGWDIDFDSEAFSANDLFVASV